MAVYLFYFHVRINLLLANQKLPSSRALKSKVSTFLYVNHEI